MRALKHRPTWHGPGNSQGKNPPMLSAAGSEPQERRNAPAFEPTPQNPIGPHGKARCKVHSLRSQKSAKPKAVGAPSTKPRWPKRSHRQRSAPARLSHPVPKLVHRRVAVEITLEVLLVELRVVKGTELRRQSSQGSNKTEDPVYRVNTKTELRLARKVEAILRFTLHRNQRTSCRGKLGDQSNTGIHRVGEVAITIRNLKARSCTLRQSERRFIHGMIVAANV